MKKTLRPLLLGSLLCSGVLLFPSCRNNNMQTILGNVCDTTNTKFAAVINPILVDNCVNACHSNSAAALNGGGLSLEGYDNVKANYDQILSSIKAGTMPKGGTALDICLITKIQTWVNRGAQNN